jgi:hypothetical protein
MESLIKAIGGANTFYTLAAFCVAAFLVLLIAMIRGGQLSKIGPKHSFNYNNKALLFLFILILLVLVLGFISTKNGSKTASSQEPNDLSTSVTLSDDLARIGRDISPPSPAQPTPTPAPHNIAPPVASSTPRTTIAPSKEGNGGSQSYTQGTPQRPLVLQGNVPAKPQKQMDPFIQIGLQKLTTLGDQGIRLEKALSREGGTVPCMDQFNRWGQECVGLLKQIDDHLEYNYKRPTNFAGRFESGARSLIPQDLLMLPSSDGFSQCKDGFRTAADALLHTIRMEISLKIDDAENE